MRAVPVSPTEAIRRKVELEWGTEDDEYLDKVERNLQKALQEHLPDVVVYNAGTDILEGDRLGGLSISPQVRPDPGGGGAGSPLGTRGSRKAGSTGASPDVKEGPGGEGFPKLRGPGPPEPAPTLPLQGIVKRDELVFRVVRGRQVPILMVTSGGYQKRTARIIADSILNLYSVGLIGSESPSLSAQNSDTPLLPPEVP